MSQVEIRDRCDEKGTNMRATIECGNDECSFANWLDALYRRRRGGTIKERIPHRKRLPEIQTILDV
ncbi:MULTISPECIES: hypothetical protein [unclassified Burkholderia]|uniref:hypothetical protein n=1 Tax=unclassified Burkholderia TaxID=2613784 RepID=UPI001091A2A0|nr:MULTISPECIES: hypothetical protein [unclassified Burkholderia]TGN98903.1 hypothetical protein PL79_002970 [Burkholderia sp. USMB20]